MIKFKAMIFAVVGAVIVIADLIITPLEITFAHKPILAFLGILVVSYVDMRISEGDSPDRPRRIFYSCIIVIFIVALASVALFRIYAPTFPFIVGCLIQTGIYFRAVRHAKRVGGASGIKIHEAPIPDIGYRIMSGILFVRDRLIDHEKMLLSAGVKEGDHLLDYGCGPGAFTFAASNIVKEAGIVYALDNQHISIESIESKIAKRGLGNVRTIYTNQGETGLDDKSVDHILLIGVLHLIRDPGRILAEVKRVLKDDGNIIVVSAHLTKVDLDKILSPLFEFEKKIDDMDILKKRAAGAAS